MLDGVTIDQLRMLVAIVDQGSFTKAAGHVQRAQSAVSHAIASLEFQLDLTLFDRSTRRPTLTDAGAAVVAEARGVIDRMDALRERARALGGDVEPRLSVAVSLLVPPSLLGAVLEDFSTRFPMTDIGLLVQEAGGPLDVVRAGDADLGVVGAFNIRGPLDEIASEPLGRVAIRAVAATDHPLVALPGPIGRMSLRDHRQLVAASAQGTGTADPLSLSVWPIADQSVRRALLLRGFGWGIVPAHLVADDIDGGRLCPLDLEILSGGAADETLHAVHKRAKPPGRAGRWLVEAIAERLQGGV
ncbi:MAG: LysR family transcriptional regulator [Pseudomonadota bacterium]